MRAQNQGLMCNGSVHADAHPACLPALFLRLPGQIDPCPQCTAGGIQTSGDNRRSAEKAGARRGRFRHSADYGITRIPVGDQVRINPELRGETFVQFHFMQIKKLEAVQLGQVLAGLTRELHGDIAVTLHKISGLTVNIRAVFPEPDHFGSRVGGKKIVSGNLENCFFPKLFFIPFTDFSGACIHPDRGSGKSVACPVDGYGGPALAVNTYGRYIRCTDIRCCKHFPDTLADCSPPFIGILLRPTRMGIINAVRSVCLGKDMPSGIKYRHFAGGCTDVNP